MKYCWMFLMFLTAGVPVSGEIPQGYSEVSSTESLDLKTITGRLGKTRSYQAEFLQERHLAAFQDVLKSTGVLYFQLPDKLRWETREPYAAALISSGNHVARFLAEGHGWKKMDLGMQDMFQQIVTEITGILRGDFQALFADYRIYLAPDKARLLLLPRRKELQNSIASLAFTLDHGSGHVSRVTIEEARGDFIEITFQNQKENPQLTDALFSLQSPEPPR